MRNLNVLDDWRSIGYETIDPDTFVYPAWVRVENGQYMSLAARTEGVEKASLWVTLYDADEDGQMPGNPDEWMGGAVYTLGTFSDFEEFQFWAPAGGCKVTAHHPNQPVPEGERLVWIYTGQGENWVQPPEDDESFAMIMERAPRNEEFDLMMQKMLHNSQRMINAQAEERDRAFERRIARMDAQHKADLEALRAEGKSAAAGGEASGSGETVADGGASDGATPSPAPAKGGGKDAKS